MEPIINRITCVSFHSENMINDNKMVKRQAGQFNADIMDMGVLYRISAKATSKETITQIAPAVKA